MLDVAAVRAAFCQPQFIGNQANVLIGGVSRALFFVKFFGIHTMVPGPLLFISINITKKFSQIHMSRTMRDKPRLWHFTAPQSHWGHQSGWRAYRCGAAISGAPADKAFWRI
jgi:hypothetical protein